MSKTFVSTLAALLIIVLIAPAAFFVAPQRAAAGSSGCIGGLLGAGAAALGINVVSKAVSVPVSDTGNTIVDAGTAGATFGTCVNELIVMPLIRAAIKKVIQKMTSSVVNWINGANSSGSPSYVGNLSTHLQSVGDSAGLSLIAKVANGFNSPFGAAISSALKSNYAQQTSLAGFFMANRNTLPGTTQSQQAFLSGSWSQGGLASWFALTTQPQNNPYMLYQTAQSQVVSNVTQVQTNRRQDLIQSSGFLSLCPAGSSSSSSTGTGTSSVSPVAPCTDANGNPVQSVTPGALIHDYASKAVAQSGFDQQYAQLISANDIDSALNTIVNSVIDKVLGSAQGLLSGGTGPSASGSGSGNLNAVLQSYSDSSLSGPQTTYQTAQDISANAIAYANAWVTINAAANTASNSLTSLINTCTAVIPAVKADSAIVDPQLTTFINAATKQIADAQTALTAEVAPVLADAQTASSTAATTLAFAAQVNLESVAGTTNDSSVTLASDIAKLATMPPSPLMLSTAQSNAQSGGGGNASPAGSLNITSGTLIDQMNLITSNAKTLQATVCAHPTPTPLFNFGGFGG